MSVINQVLEDLQRRGILVGMDDIDANTTAIRICPVSPPKPVALWLTSGLSMLLILAVGGWLSQWNNAEIPHAQPLPVAAVKVEYNGSAPIVIQPLAKLVDTDMHAMGNDVQPAAVVNGAIVSVSNNASGNASTQAGHSQLAASSVRHIAVAAPIKQVSKRQQSDNELRLANELMQRGHTQEALDGFHAALLLDGSNEAARLAKVGLLLQNNRQAEAIQVLQIGHRRFPQHSGFAMLLARLLVEQGEVTPALQVLHKTLPYAKGQADYQAFLAALLQRQGRHQEAVTHYQAAINMQPNKGVWLMGMGISLQALQHNTEAGAVFKRALESQSLSAELQTFVQHQLDQLQG